jgi:hypothetical protein
MAVRGVTWPALYPDTEAAVTQELNNQEESCV